MELWEALSNRRKEIGMSFDELQKKADLSISTLKKILGGHVVAPSYESVRAIAYAMDITMAELDRRIKGEAEPATIHRQPALTAEALEIAEAYMKLDEIGQEVVRAVVKIEKKRKGLNLPPSMKQIGIVNGVPLYEGKLDGTAETKFAARKEPEEIETESETRTEV